MSEPTWVYVCETVKYLDSMLGISPSCGNAGNIERECLISINEAANDYIAEALFGALLAAFA